MQTIGDGAARLVLLRHGQSEWNANNRFTGWANPDLTEAGMREAGRAGRLFSAHRLLPDRPAAGGDRPRGGQGYASGHGEFRKGG